MTQQATSPTNQASRLGDVIRCVLDIFSAIGDATPIQVGKEYLKDFGVGTAPKILFVPNPKGTAGDPPKGTAGAGFVGGVDEGCDVYVRAVGDGSDLGRVDAVEDLSDRVRNAIERVARGRLEWSTYQDDSPSGGTDAYGADFAMSFTYSRGVQRDKFIWALPPNPIASSPPNINIPPGTPASTVEPLNVTVVPQS